MVQVQNLELALGMALKFCTSVTNELRISKLSGLIPMFVEVTWEKLAGGFFRPCPTPPHPEED